MFVPGIRIKRSTVTEEDGLSRAPVLIINLRAVFSCDCTHLFVPHIIILLFLRVWGLPGEGIDGLLGSEFGVRAASPNSANAIMIIRFMQSLL